MDMETMLQISAAGMKAQGTRLRVIAENIANSQTTGEKPGADPYRRQMITFKDVLDRSTGVKTVQTGNIVYDQTPFVRKYDPSHPAADATGYVTEPNVKPIIEVTDMREAERAYDANLTMIETAKSMASRELDILKSN